jgi:hypothetical protein
VNYCSLDELREHIMANGGGDFTPVDKNNMQIAIAAVSRWLDQRYNTTFYGRTLTQEYTPRSRDLLWVEDLLSVTAVTFDESRDGTYSYTLPGTAYWLEPRNAPDKNQPYRQIRLKPDAPRWFPTGQMYGVRIAGSFGYSATTPAFIKQFTLLFAHRLWKRKDAIFGVAGAPALGVQVIQAEIRRDMDLLELLTGISERGFYAP